MDICTLFFVESCTISFVMECEIFRTSERTTGSRMQFPEMVDYLYRKGLLSDVYPNELPVNKMFGELSSEEFDRIVDSFVLTVTPDIAISSLGLVCAV